MDELHSTPFPLRLHHPDDDPPREPSVLTTENPLTQTLAPNEEAEEGKITPLQPTQPPEMTKGSPTPQRPTPYPVTSASSRVDWSTAPRLGFPPSSKPHVREAESHYRPIRESLEAKRQEQWQAACRGVPLLASCPPSSVRHLRQLTRRWGIPSPLRTVLWLTLTGVAAKIDENECYCQTVLRRQGNGIDPQYLKAIEVDLERTFPGHPYFSESDIGIYKLRNVLHVLYWRYPLISYCQSFNFLIAFLLVLFDDEERAFWTCCFVLEELLPNDYYDENLLGARLDQVVFEDLVQERLPAVHHTCTRIGVDLKTLTPNWLMSLYVNTFPISTVLRVWDYILVESSCPHDTEIANSFNGRKTAAHLEIALAVLKLCERSLTRCEDVGEVHVMMHDFTASLFDVEKLILCAKSLAITPEELHCIRRRRKPSVVQEVRDREARRLAFQERQLKEACSPLLPAHPTSLSKEPERKESVERLLVELSLEDAYQFPSGEGVEDGVGPTADGNALLSFSSPWSERRFRRFNDSQSFHEDPIEMEVKLNPSMSSDPSP